MISVHHHHFSVAIRIYRVISESNFIAFTSRVYDKICNTHKSLSLLTKCITHFLTTLWPHRSFTIVQVKKKTAHVFIVDFPATIGFILRYNFAAILRNELVFLSRLFQKYAPASDIWWCEEQMFAYGKKKKVKKYFNLQIRNHRARFSALIKRAIERKWRQFKKS